MLLRSLVLRPLLRDKLRALLTLIGVAVGVAVVVAIQLANQSSLRAFRESVDAVAGRANYQIVGDGGTLDENLLLPLQRFWGAGVRFAPVIDVDGVLEPRQLPLRLLAVDLLSDLHFRDYRYAQISVDPGRSPAGSAGRFLEVFRSDSVVLPAAFARDQGLSLGSPVTMNVLGNRRRMVIRGILESRGPATAFNGSIAICDIATAQSAFGLTGRLTRVDLLIPEAAAPSVVEQVKRLLPAGTRIERPSRRNERVERMLRAFRVNLYALAGVALLVGIFLVYNTVLISILRRRREVGIARTLGSSSASIARAFLLEGLTLGLVGSAIGLVLGRGMAVGILRLVGRTINSLYVTSRPDEISLSPTAVAVALITGTLLSLLASLHPAIEASRVPPETMTRQGLHQRIERQRRGMLTAIAVSCFIAAAAAARIPPIGGIAVAGYLSVLLVVIGFSMLSPLIVQWTARALGPLLDRLFGPVGRLAASSLPASLRRTSIAAASLSVAIGMMVAVALMVGSFRVTVNTWVRQTVQSDLWLRPSKGLSNADSAFFPAEILGELRRFNFIAAADPVRGREVLYGDDLVTVGSGDFSIAAKFGDLPMVAPRSAAEALGKALRSGGVFVSESFSIKFRKGIGDVITIPTAGSPQSFPIVGIYRDYSNDRGVVVMDRAQYVRLYRDASINTIAVFLKPGTNKEAARRDLERSLGARFGAFAVMNADIRREVMRIFDQTFAITYALLGIAIAVAVLGIINTLSALILERRRELALLRVAGLTQREVGTMLVLESSILGVVATVTGTVMGYLLSLILIFVINRQSFGWTIEFHAPAGLIAVSLGMTFLAAALAGFVPARLAASIDISRAIKAE